nr:hypothetical protein Itr_chr07CG07390 [Ipomoea trifida]
MDVMMLVSSSLMDILGPKLLTPRVVVRMLDHDIGSGSHKDDARPVRLASEVGQCFGWAKTRGSG